MSIADRVRECIDKYNAGDNDNALIQLCIALDATAKAEYPTIPQVGDRFKKFIRDNHDVITYFTLHGNIVRGEFRVGDLTFDELIYKVLRCGLLHEGKVPELLKFVEAGMPATIGSDKWQLPKQFIIGGVLAVTGAGTNAGLLLPAHYAVSIGAQSLPLNSVSGHIEVVRTAIYAGRDV